MGETKQSVISNNLPTTLTSFVGREREITDVKFLLEKSRLLTLTGSGGCGKTRLALQSAQAILEQYPDGVWLLELAPLTEGSLLASGVAQALGIKEWAGQSLLETILESLKGKSLLLVMDNCEHIVTCCAELVDSLLRYCPNIKVLATSREALGIGGEQNYRVPPLTMPDLSQPCSVDYLLQFEAIRLFIERAKLVKADFTLTNQNALALAQMCYRLDGIPLALELAAARCHSLTVEEISSRLHNRFRLLIHKDRVILPRHQTLRATIDWSWDLMSTQEKILLERLSVFAGGWTLEAAEFVGADAMLKKNSIIGIEILNVLTSLVEKNLIETDVQEEATRYRMLETVRQYAASQLDERGDTMVVRNLHLDWFLHLAEAAEPQLLGRDQARWLVQLETEHDNLRRALSWCFENSTSADAGLRLVASLSRFWEKRGYLSEAREYFEQSLSSEATQSETICRANALNRAGRIAHMQADYRSALKYFQEGLDIHKKLGNRQGIGWSLKGLGRVADRLGNYELAKLVCAESLEIHKELNDRHGIASSLHNLGYIYFSLGEYGSAPPLLEQSLTIRCELEDRSGISHSLNALGKLAHCMGYFDLAQKRLEESLTIYEELKDSRGMARSLNDLASLANSRGDHTTARQLYKQSLQLKEKLGYRRGIAVSLEGLAIILIAERNVQSATCILGAAHSLRKTLGIPCPPNQSADNDMQISNARSMLSNDIFMTAWEEGCAMNWQRAVAYALKETEA